MAWDFTDLVPYTYLIVGILSAVMAWWSLQSYRNTGNLRILFVLIAFVALTLKSLVVMANEWSPTHPIDHHPLLVVMGVLDVLIVLLFFVPFLAVPKKDG